MTAINVFLQRNVGHIVTDSAWYDANGRVLHFGSKAQPVAHWPGAIALRGPAFATGLIALEAGLRFEDFDSFMEGAVDFLRSWVEREHHTNGLAAWGSLGTVQMTAVGWSKREGRPRAFITASATEVGERADLEDVEIELLRLQAYQFDEIDSAFVLPMPTMESLSKHGVNPETDLDEVPSMLEFGTRILRAQREYQAPMKDGGPPVCFVGGYVMHTSVTEHGVSSVRSLSFNDRVGEVMAADPGATVIPLKVPPAGPERLTRQQRRAAEAQARKERTRA